MTNKKSSTKITLTYKYMPASGFTNTTNNIYTKTFSSKHEALEFIEFHPLLNKTLSSLNYQFAGESGWTTHYIY